MKGQFRTLQGSRVTACLTVQARAQHRRRAGRHRPIYEFATAIGADNPEKSETAPALMARARVITDVTAQAALMGDLNHAIQAGAMSEADVHAEIGEIVDSRKSGRSNSEEITIFDGVGVGIQDVAASVRAYELARERGAGTRVSLG